MPVNQMDIPGLDPLKTQALIRLMMSGAAGPGAPANLLSAPVQAPAMAAPAPAIQAPNPAAVPTGPAPNIMSQLSDAAARYARSWSDPSYTSQAPFHRGEEQTGLQNTLAGFGNNLLNSPQNIWHLYSQMVGKPFADAAKAGAGKVWDFTTKPEAQVKQEAEGAKGPASPTFTPGLPGLNSKIAGVESGGNNYAKNPASSAYGPGQFVKGTWMEFMREKYPEVVKNKDQSFVLGLRSDPKFADEAMTWYAGKGVDALDAINMPASDTNLYLHHFLGAGGVTKLLTADPNAKASDVLDPEQVKANASVLGGNNTVQDVIDWAATKMGEGAGMAPVPRPQQVAPNFSAAQDWFKKAEPRQIDQNLLNDEKRNLLLQGIFQGNASVDAGDVGVSGLLASLGGGAWAGKEAGSNLTLQFADQLAKAKSGYAEGMGKFESDKAVSDAALTNANAATSYANESDSRAFQVQKAAAERMAQAPKILETNAQGMWIQSPDGQPSFISAKSQWDDMESMAKVLGGDSNQVRSIKYQTMAQGNDLLGMEMEIVKDLIKDGMGPAVFGDGYAEALDAAQKQLPPGLDPKTALTEAQKSVAAILLGGSQQKGNYDWVTQAASLGNPGAMLLVQGGSLTPQ